MEAAGQWPLIAHNRSCNFHEIFLLKQHMKIFIIGNGPIINPNMAPGTDDIVVRFNMPSKQSMTIADGRTDYLFAANSKAVFLENLEKGLLESKAVRSRPIVVMPYHPTIIRSYLPKRRHKFLKIFRKRGIDDGTLQCIEAFGKSKLTLLLLSSALYENCCAALNIDNRLPSPQVPSTGYIAINYFINNPHFRSHKIVLDGFSWQGWHGHAWGAERQQIENLVQQGKILIESLPSPSQRVNA